MASITIDSMNQYAPTVLNSTNRTAVTAPLVNQAGKLSTIGGNFMSFIDGNWAKAYGLELYNARKAGTLKDFQWADTYRDIVSNQKTVQHPGFFASIKGGAKKLCGKESGLRAAEIITGKEAEIRATARAAMKAAYKDTVKNAAEGTAKEVVAHNAKLASIKAGKAALKTARSSVGTATQEAGKAIAKTGIFSKIKGVIGKRLGPIVIGGMTLYSMYQGYKEGGVVEALKEGIKGIGSMVFFSAAIVLATALLGPIGLPLAFIIGMGGSMIGDKIMNAVLGKSIAEKKAEAAEQQEEAQNQVATTGANNISTGNIYGDLAKIDPNIAAKMARDSAYFNGGANPFMQQNPYLGAVPSAIAS